MDAQDTLPRLVYRRALSTPDQIALTSVGQGSVTWREVWENSRRWAGWLEDNGVVSGDRVVTLVPQSLEAAYVWMGCCLIGAVEASINYEFRGEWLRHAIQVSSAKVIVLSTRFLDQLLPVLEGSAIEKILLYDGAAAEMALAAKVQVVSTPPAAARMAGGDAEPNVFAHDIGCILYTSGTTGASKAVQLPWALLDATWRVPTSLVGAEPQVYYFPYSMHHASGRGALYCAALTGGRSVTREIFSTSSFWDDIRQHGCTYTGLFGAPARFLIDLPERADDTDNPLKLVCVLPLLPQIDSVKRRFGVEVYSVYGMTEIGNPFVVRPNEAISANAGSCGRPVAGVEARLVDAHDYPVPLGSPGELVLRSTDPWRFTCGYEGAPEATAKAWRNGWFHTGDIFRVDAKGNYYYLDRSKDMIRRRGENISSAELEAAVLTHPCIAEVAALGVASTFADEEVLIAVVARAGQRINPPELISYLKDIVPRFAVPRYVRVLDALPKTPVTQRVQKQALRTQAVTPDTWDRLSAGATTVNPQT